MTPEEQRIVDAVTGTLAGEIYVGARVQFPDGFYTVIKRGSVEITDYGRGRMQWWGVERDDRYTTAYPERDLLVRLV